MSIAVSATTMVGQRNMTGSEKVAALLLAMGKPLASRLLKHFDPTELKSITRSAAALGSVPMDTLEELVEELAGQFSRGVDLQGTAAEVEQLLGGVLPAEQVAEIMADVRGSSNSSTWVRLSGIPEKELAAYITKEHPQTAALILSRLTPETAARTLAITPLDFRNAMTRRMLALRPVSESMIRILETKLRDDLLHNPGRDQAKHTQARMVDILNRMEPDQAQEVVTSLATVKPVEAAAIKAKMFSFSDLDTLSAKARAVLLDKVPSDRIVLALKGTSQAFRETVLSAMGARARRLVENELNNNVGSPKEVMAARQFISSMVLDLVSKGEIEIGGEAEAAG